MRSIKPNTRAACLALAVLVTLLLAGCSGGSSLANGAKYQAEGKYRAASIEAKKILQHDDKDAGAWLLLGKASLMLGDPKAARDDLDKARTHGAAPAAWAVPLGQALLVSQAYDKLLDELPAKPDFDATTNAEVLVLRGDAFRELKQFNQAQGAYQQALASVPRDALALVGLARLAAASHDMDAAGKYVQQALAAAPDSPQAWTTKADLAFASGDAAGAEAAYQKAINIKHADWLPQQQYYARVQCVSAQLQQGKLTDALDGIQTLQRMAPQQPYPHYLHALVLYRQHHYDDAVTQLQQVLQKSPNDAEAQMLLGVVNYAQGSYSQAEMQFSSVLGTDQGNVGARRLLALAQYRQGRSQQALATLRPSVAGQASDAQLLAQLKQASSAEAPLPGMATSAAASAVAAQPASGLARADQALVSGNESEAVRLLTQMPAGDASLEAQRNILLVITYVKEKRLADAVKVAAAYVAKHPDDSGAHLLYGTTLITAGKRDAARAQYLEALKLNPKNLAALLSLGSLEALEGHYPAAAARYQAALKQDPHSAAAMAELGRLAMQQGDQTQARKWFTQAIAAEPKAPAAYLGLLTLQTQARQFGDAVDTATRLVAAVPGSPEALNALGAAQFNAGHADAALRPLQQAVAAAPQVPAYRINLARVQILTKHSADAERSLAEVIKGEPGDVTAVAMLAQLKARDHDLPGALALARTLQTQPDVATKATGFALEGDLYMADKQFDKADAAYQHGLQVQASQALVMRQFQALAAGGAKAPDSVLVDWLGKHPDATVVRLLLGQYYLGRAQLAQAADQYQRVLKAQPENVGALNNLAWIYTEQHDPKALALAAQAYKLAPDAPGIGDTYGWALLAAGRPAEALPILARAAKKAPKAAEIQFHLAVAQSRSGDVTAAKATLDALTKSGATFKDKPEAEKLLSDLDKQ